MTILNQFRNCWVDQRASSDCSELVGVVQTLWCSGLQQPSGLLSQPSQYSQSWQMGVLIAHNNDYKVWPATRTNFCHSGKKRALLCIFCVFSINSSNFWPTYNRLLCWVHSGGVSSGRICGCGCWHWWQMTDILYVCYNLLFCFGVIATIWTHQDIQCLQCAEFFLSDNC